MQYSGPFSSLPSSMTSLNTPAATTASLCKELMKLIFILIATAFLLCLILPLQPVPHPFCHTQLVVYVCVHHMLLYCLSVYWSLKRLLTVMNYVEAHLMSLHIDIQRIILTLPLINREPPDLSTLTTLVGTLDNIL